MLEIAHIRQQISDGNVPAFTFRAGFFCLSNGFDILDFTFRKEYGFVR
jgi:hypothetical protein